ncbi:MAG: PilZ domain-containing protein [Deltaproteobacteria bacterium]|nr:PilZ domain-containing protein [Deltaproteobacteria bacterium]
MKDIIMEDCIQNKRKHERFDLALPAKVEIDGRHEGIVFNTRDISAGGAFITTSEPMKEGSRLKLEIIITNETLRKLTGTQPRLTLRGTVVRAESEGVAVSFSSHEHMMPLSMMDN